MNTLIDTDILIDVALDREPFSNNATYLLDLAENHHFKAFIAWHSLSNFYYIINPVKNSIQTKSFIKDLLTFVNVASVSSEDAEYALNLNIPDFEDALQIASAWACKAEFIITRNLKHYKKSPIPAIQPKDFIKKFKIK